MAITNGYATLAELGVRVGMTSADLTNKTTLIEREIERNSRMIDTITGSFFYTKTLTASTVRFDLGYNADNLRLSEDAQYITFPAPILTITLVSNDGTALVLNQDYFMGRYDITSNSIFSTNRRTGVAITGTMGYASTPDQINEICLAMTEVTTGLGTKTVTDSSGDKLTIARDEMPDWVADRLSLFMRFDNVA